MTELIQMTRDDLFAMIEQVRQETMQDMIDAAKKLAGIAPVLYTRDEVAEILKVDARTMCRLDDLLPKDNKPIKFGKSLRYDSSHIAFFKGLRK